MGLAAVTAVFSVFYSTILKPPPYPEPGRLVAVHSRFPQLPRMGMSPLDYVELRSHRELFSDAGAYYFVDLTRTGIDRPVKVNAVAVTSSLFDTLGVRPLLGRTFSPNEERPQGPHAVLLSERYWREQFAGDPQILARTLQLDGELYQIAGVMPQSFAFPNDVTQMWVPIAFKQSQLTYQNVFLRMYARLAPGVTLDQASARMEQLSGQSSRDHPDARRSTSAGWSMFVSPMAHDDDGSLRRWVTILFAAVLCLLLIVCSNVAGLLLVRSSERQFELSVRVALGAGRFRIARQLLTEVLMLSIGSGALGLLLARAGVSLLSEYGPAGKLQFEAPVFWFGALLSLVTGLVCGLYPAWSATRIPAADSLKAGGHQRTAAKRTWQQGLIVAQVALATTLLLCGGLLMRSLIRLLDVPLGFDPRNVLSMEITLPESRYPTPEARGRFFKTLLEDVAGIPGIESVSGCTLLPFGYGENVNTFEIVGQPKPPLPAFALINNVLPGYCGTLRIPLLRGRYLAAQDRPGTEPVALIDDTLAKQFSPGIDPIGQQLKMPWGTFTIAGIVGGVKNNALDIENRPTVYFSAQQTPTPGSTLVIRSQLPVNTIEESIQRVVARIDPDEPVYNVMPLQTFIDRSVKTRRFIASITSIFAGAGIALAALGLFGLLSYVVALRRREIGIRMAVGASSQAIALLVCRGGISLMAIGAILGALTAVCAHRLMASLIASQLYGTQFEDAGTWVAVLGVVTATGLLACAGPAWRAVRTDPIQALRDE